MAEKRIRSPNYPALSLPEAIARVTALYREQHTHGATREDVARGMGFNSLNGASATAISALYKYGLLEGRADEVRVSERALRILHPHSPEEKASAIQEAAIEPQLFVELAQRFPGKLPNEELLRNYLIRAGFAPSAVSSVILAYRETFELVNREVGEHDSLHEPMQEHAAMNNSPSPSRPENPQPWMPPQTLVSSAERPIGRYDYEDGSYIKIVASGDVDTEAALEMVETLIALKRKELERRKASVSPLGTERAKLGPPPPHLSGGPVPHTVLTDSSGENER